MPNASGFYTKKTDIELSLIVIRDWARDESDSGIDWRRIHAAANILAVALFDGAGIIKDLRAAVMGARQEVRKAEALAHLTAIAQLTTGRAFLPTGEKLEPVSYSVAKDLARQFVPIDAGVITANANLLRAEADFTEYEQKLEAMKEIAQGAKSTAQRLTQEP